MPDILCSENRTFSFDPARTALIAIDMQRDFIDPEGACPRSGCDVSALQEMLPRALLSLNSAREAGFTIIHTREGYAPDLSDVHPLKRERYGAGTEGPLGRMLIVGEYGQDFVDEFQPLQGERVFDKPGFGAFYRTGLEDYLHELNITHLVIFGVTTQCCVQSTLREAVDRGFYCLTLEDCCAAYDMAVHDATFLIIKSEGNLFGWSTTGDTFNEAVAKSR